MNTDRYILNEDNQAVPEPDLLTWARWLGTADRTVERTQVGVWEVSTIFLGLNHSFGDGGPPLLFETMVFGGEVTRTLVLDGETRTFTGRHSEDGPFRYSTWEAAMAGHRRVVQQVRHELYLAHRSEHKPQEDDDVKRRRGVERKGGCPQED